MQKFNTYSSDDNTEIGAIEEIDHTGDPEAAKEKLVLDPDERAKFFMLLAFQFLALAFSFTTIIKEGFTSASYYVATMQHFLSGSMFAVLGYVVTGSLLIPVIFSLIKLYRPQTSSRFILSLGVICPVVALLAIRVFFEHMENTTYGYESFGYSGIGFLFYGLTLFTAALNIYFLGKECAANKAA